MQALCDNVIGITSAVRLCVFPNVTEAANAVVLATLNLITAAIARWPLISGLGPLAFFAITDLFVAALALWDLKSRKKMHRVTLRGGLMLILSHPVRLVVSGTAVWLSFAAWATGLVK